MTVNWNISDMMDHYEENDILLEDGGASADRVLDRTMAKVRQAQRPRHIRRRAVLIAAACAVTVLLGCTAAAAVTRWHGFALLDEVSKEEQAEIIRAATTNLPTESIDADGTVTRCDGQGNVIDVMTAEEYREWEQAQIKAQDAAVIASTDLVDLSTFEVIPSSATELTVEAGAIPDMMLGNGALVVLKQANNAGWELQAGDQVTITVNGTEPCNFFFGLVRDQEVVDEGRVSRTLPDSHENDPAAATPAHTFTIPENGTYYFVLEYGSIGVGTFTGNTITITQS